MKLMLGGKKKMFTQEWTEKPRKYNSGTNSQVTEKDLRSIFKET